MKMMIEIREELAEKERFYTDKELWETIRAVWNGTPITERIHFVPEGQWVVLDDGFYRPSCSNCGGAPWKGYIPTAEEATKVFKFCPICGAEMRGDKAEHPRHTAIEALKQESKIEHWIPVSERLPEDRREVLVTAYWHETYQVMMASYFGDGIWWCVPFNNCGEHMQRLNPKAWMPLHEPYKAEEEKMLLTR